MKRNSKRFVSVLLILTMFVSLLTGCGKTEEEMSFPTGSASITLSPTGEAISNTPTVRPKTPSVTQTVNNGVKVVAKDAGLVVSEDWRDYVGNLEVFVYGLIATDLGTHFDVFPAAVTLSDGTEVCGIAYTDYSECFGNEDGTDGIVTAGFVSAIGDEAVPIDEFESGLEIENLEIPETTFSYILTYRSDACKSHCVVYGQYLVYGIDNDGRAFYESQPYQSGQYDESLGSLYSYDEARYIVDFEVGEFIPLTGVPIIESIDFASIEKEINDIISRQNVNFVSVDTESCIAVSKAAVKSYLLSLQEETFLGYDVKTLVDLAEDLDARECFRITEDGLMVISVKPIFREPTSLMKWIVGSATVIAFAVSSLGSFVASECPIISSAFGAIAGTAVELFMQVVVENKDVRDVNWNTVALAAVTGAVGGAIYTYVGAFSDESLPFSVLDTLIDGTLGGAERVLRSKMNGSDWEEAIDQFGSGFIIASVASVGTKALFKTIGKLTPGKPVAGSSKDIQQGTKTKFHELLEEIKAKLDGSKFHSETLMRRHMEEQIEHSIKQLSGSITDLDGNSIDKSQLAQIAKKAKDGEQIGYVFSESGKVQALRKWNQNVGPDFPEETIGTAYVGKIVADRPTNYNNAAAVFLEEYKKNPDKIPKEIIELMDETGNNIEDITVNKFVEMIKKSKYVFHECADLKTVIIMSRAVHEEFRHAGGYSVAKAIEIRIGKMEFSKLYGVAAVGGSY